MKPTSVHLTFLLTLSLAFAACQAPVQTQEKALAVATVEDMGPLSAPATVLGRDGGSSALVEGKLLWAFGDTFVNAKTEDGSSVRSSTAAWSDPQSPLALSEPLDAKGLPAQFIPYTADEAADNARDVLNGWALWPGRILHSLGGRTLVLYQRIRRSNGSGFNSQGIGIARVAPGTTTATRDPEMLFTPPEPLFGSGGTLVEDRYVYLYECSIIGFLNMGCKVARAERAKADQKSAYLFYDGKNWVSDIAAAQVVMEHSSAGVSVSWNAYLGRYLAVHSEILSNRIQLRTAAAPEGPWSEPVTIESSATGILPATGQGATNYLAQEHLELSSTDGKTIVVGYSRPTAPFRGEIRLARVTLQ
jgi:hypothetical protein